MAMKEECRYQYQYETPIGKIWIEEKEQAISGLYLEGKTNPESKPSIKINEKETDLMKRAYRQLEEYFKGCRKTFDLPLFLEGTDFQKKVWSALREIPYGETRSYEEIAKAIGNPKACRAVGGANHKNRILILVPCHRVIGKDGSLVGFGGKIEVKDYLLRLEKGTQK